MRLTHLLFFLVWTLTACGKTAETPEPISNASLSSAKAAPNIIMIVIDDLGWSDVGYNQTTDLFETPNLDAFALQSLRFDNAYSGAANCAPSRAVLMSGQYGPRHGVYTVSPSTRGEEKTRKLIPIKNERGIKLEVVTLAETLKTAGYATGNFGKWHLGPDPDAQGFDVNVAGSHQGMTRHYFSPYKLNNIEDGPEGEYLTDRLTTDAINWMRSTKDAPFFAYLPYYTVHTPFQAAADKIEKYEKKGIESKSEATYAAMVEHMDINIGRIFDMLEAEKIAENTLVIFTSDNGGYRMTHFPSPLRAGKGSYYEGGLRVPLLVRWPEAIQPGDNSTPVINADFYPTLASLTKAERPAQILDGMDLSRILLEQENPESRDLFWHFPVYLQAHNTLTDQGQDPLFRTRPGSAMRSGNWKLLHYFEYDEYELYDLSKDIGEKNNLAETQPEKLNELKAKLQAWRDGIGADMPTEQNPAFDADYNQKLIDEVYAKAK